MTASIDSHIMRYCSEPRLYKSRDRKLHPEGTWGALCYARCRGHREPRPVEIEGVASRWWRNREPARRGGQAKPMDNVWRAAAYGLQNRRAGRLTPRQLRRIQRKANANANPRPDHAVAVRVAGVPAGIASWPPPPHKPSVAVYPKDPAWPGHVVDAIRRAWKGLAR